MGRPRKSLAAARLSGAIYKNPQRYRDRTEPWSPPIETAPRWLKPSAAAAFERLRAELPWLQVAHTGHVAITAILLAKMEAGAASIREMNLLRICLTQLCATPVSASKIITPTDEPEDDLADEFFN